MSYIWWTISLGELWCDVCTLVDILVQQTGWYWVYIVSWHFIIHVIIVLAYIKFSIWSQNCQTTKLNHCQMYCVYGNKQLLWSNYFSIVNVQPHNFYVPSLNKVVLKCICVGFKGLLNGVNLILIVQCLYRQSIIS